MPLPHLGIDGRDAANDDDTFEQGLWQTYWSRRDVASRNELLVAYRSIVETVLNRLPHDVKTYWDRGDLRSFGTLGLIDAVERFAEGSLVHHFPRYGAKRVRGAIFDELRRLDWLPRGVRRRVIDYRSTVDDLAIVLQRIPSSREVFDSLNLRPDQGADLLAEVRSSQLFRLDHATEHDGDAGNSLLFLLAHDDHGPESQLLASEEMLELKAAIASLPERQRTVISLHFLSNLTQEEIGRHLGVTRSRVCQIEAQALLALRQQLSSTRMRGSA